MTDFSPPLGGAAPPLQCNRALEGPLDNPTRYCGKPGTWHIIWTADCENGIACDEHYAEAKSRWVFYAAHPYEPVCSMPGAVFLVDENRCVVDEDLLGFHASEARELVLDG